MKNARTFFSLLALGFLAACGAAEPTAPSTKAGRPHASSYMGSGYDVPPDTTQPPSNTGGQE